MSQPTPDPTPLERSLARVRVSVLVGIAVCAAVVLSQAGVEQESIDRATTISALALALGSIVTRRLAGAPTTPPRWAVGFSVAGMLLALAVGGLGVAIAQAQSARENGLLLALGAFILALPRPRLPSLSGPAKS